MITVKELMEWCNTQNSEDVVFINTNLIKAEEELNILKNANIHNYIRKNVLELSDLDAEGGWSEITEDDVLQLEAALERIIDKTIH